MCDGVEVEVWMHGTQGCLVACVRTEPGTEKGVQMHLTQPDVAPDYRTHRTHRTQSPHYESQDATPPHLTQDGFLLMLISISDAKRLSQGDAFHHAFTVELGSADSNWLTGYTVTKGAPSSTTTKP